MTSLITDLEDCSTARPEALRQNGLWTAVVPHCLPRKFHCGFAISTSDDKYCKHLTFMINSSPKSIAIAIDPYKFLISQMPLPLHGLAHGSYAIIDDLFGDYWPESIPPGPHRIMGDIDARSWSTSSEVYPDPQVHPQQETYWGDWIWYIPRSAGQMNGPT